MFANKLKQATADSINQATVERQLNALLEKCELWAKRGSTHIRAEVVEPGENEASRFCKKIVSLSCYSNSAEDKELIRRLRAEGLTLFFGADGAGFLRWS